MDIFKLYNKDSCDIRGKYGTEVWSWKEYFDNKLELQKQGIQVILVDMIGHPIEESIPISNEMFFDGKYKNGTIFALYCHSGGSSGYIQKQLKSKLPQYHIINIDGGIMSYQIWKMNN